MPRVDCTASNLTSPSARAHSPMRSSRHDKTPKNAGISARRATLSVLSRCRLASSIPRVLY
eukprot:scaffold59777_cov28-Tisochrysis_lutea.AAC.1